MLSVAPAPAPAGTDLTAEQRAALRPRRRGSEQPRAAGRAEGSQRWRLLRVAGVILRHLQEGGAGAGAQRRRIGR